ncbi:hypothetical protein [Calothrix sp. CCY 0018]|uniref:hypothetical protein n=1 Tax=Calothrix sp. CCY 0018 TaxID=3103864 RepID=UPI0039C621DD
MFNDALRVGIYIPTRKLSCDEINYLIKQEEVSSLALERFLSAEISWNDYLDILEVCNVDIDDYLETSDQNFASIM